MNVFQQASSSQQSNPQIKRARLVKHVTCQPWGKGDVTIPRGTVFNLINKHIGIITNGEGKEQYGFLVRTKEYQVL